MIKWGNLKKYFFNIKNIDFKYIKKSDSIFMKFLNLFLKTFKINNEFMTKYTTVISENIYYPDSFLAPKMPLSIYDETLLDMSTFLTIVHESIHVLQEKREKNKLIYWLKYLLSKNNRAKYEEEAYITNLFLTGQILIKNKKPNNLIKLNLENLSNHIKDSLVSGYAIGENNGKIVYKNFIKFLDTFMLYANNEISDKELYRYIEECYTEGLASSLICVMIAFDK